MLPFVVIYVSVFSDYLRAKKKVEPLNRLK